MAQIPITINNGQAPYVISVKRDNDNTERYQSLSGSTLSFQATADGTSYGYTVLVNDNAGCATNARFNLMCGSVPAFTLSASNRQCGNGGQQDTFLVVSNMSNMDRFSVEMGPAFTQVNDCTSPARSGFNTSVQQLFQVNTPAEGQSQVYTVRAWTGSGCNPFTDHSVSVTAPTCGGGCVPNPINISEDFAGVAEIKTLNYTNTDCVDYTLRFLFDPYTVPDKISLKINGTTIFDSGCIGTNQTTLRTVTVHPGETLQFIIDGTCSGDSSTQWQFYARPGSGNFNLPNGTTVLDPFPVIPR